MINLTDEQKEFLKKELNVTDEQISEMNRQQWNEVRESCFEISIDELLDDSVDYEQEVEVSQRCTMAESIMDMEYSELMAIS